MDRGVWQAIYNPWGLKESDMGEQLKHNNRAREMEKVVRKPCNTVLQRLYTVPGMFSLLREAKSWGLWTS